MSGGLTVEEIAARQWKPAWFVQEVLRDEQRRGNVIEQTDGKWCVTEAFVTTYASAFGCLVPTAPNERAAGVPAVTTPW